MRSERWSERKRVDPAEHARNASYVLPPSDSLSKCISFFICAFSFRSSQHFLVVSHLFLAQNTVSIAPNLSAFSFVRVSHSLTLTQNMPMTAMMPSRSKQKFVPFNFSFLSWEGTGLNSPGGCQSVCFSQNFNTKQISVQVCYIRITPGRHI